MSPATLGRRIDVPQTQWTTTMVIVCGDTEVVSWPLDAHCPPDLSSIEELARLGLAARRLGWSIRLRHASGELSDLLDLVGLAGAGDGEVAEATPDRLVVEVKGEAEQPEEVGVEERVERGDAVP